MGKKSQTTESAPAAAAPAADTPSGTLADAIRAALDVVGDDASKKAVSNWIKEHHPNLTFKESTLNSSLSSIRKKLKGETGPSGQEPTINELLKVKQLAEEQGGVDHLLAQIEKVDTLARKLGGLPRLRRCLEGLKRLGK
jgi:hypothetical protein